MSKGGHFTLQRNAEILELRLAFLGDGGFSEYP